jgi:serine/threonine protein kinase
MTAATQPLSLDSLRQLLALGVPEDILGADPDTIATRFREYSKICHPDINPGDSVAEEVFKQLTAIRDAALSPPPPIVSPKRSYRLGPLLAQGDVADVYLAIGDKTVAPEQNKFILKASRIPQGTDILQNEATVLAALLKDQEGPFYHQYLPLLVETFPARDTVPRRINVFGYAPGFVSLEQVHLRHPELDGRHIAWICNRLFEICGYVHQHGYVHGAIVPSHVLVNPETHALKLVGWGHSVRSGGTITTAPSAYLDWYPPEVREKRIANATTDMFMLARCATYLAGGDPTKGTLPKAFPSDFARKLKWCMLPSQGMRPESTWHFHDEFKQMLYGVYGKRKFVHLDMSSRPDPVAPAGD